MSVRDTRNVPQSRRLLEPRVPMVVIDRPHGRFFCYPNRPVIKLLRYASQWLSMEKFYNLTPELQESSNARLSSYGKDKCFVGLVMIRLSL